MIIPTIVFYMLVINMIFCFLFAIKYIVTEEDYVETWKEHAINNIITGLLDLFLIIGWLLGW